MAKLVAREAAREEVVVGRAIEREYTAAKTGGAAVIWIWNLRSNFLLMERVF